MKETGKSGGRVNGKQQGGGRKDRRSGSGMSGSPKKGGHGGKFTWVGDGGTDFGLHNDMAFDNKDPNFEDPPEQELPLPSPSPSRAPAPAPAAL